MIPYHEYYINLNLCLDVKPDNVMLDWSWYEDKDMVRVDRVVLTDLDCSRKLEGNKTLHGTFGNCMWRSPEGQLDTGIGLHSDIFSFGLLVRQVALLLPFRLRPAVLTYLLSSASLP